MKIPTDVAIWLQFQLFLMTIDRFSPESISISALTLSRDPRRCWQLAVDLIYRCGKCGLMEFWNTQLWRRGGVDSIQKLAMILAELNPSDRQNSLVLNYWVAPEIIGSELCRSLGDKYDLSSYSYTPDVICQPFIEKIEGLFESHGVPWTEMPLIKIDA